MLAGCSLKSPPQQSASGARTHLFFIIETHGDELTRVHVRVCVRACVCESWNKSDMSSKQRGDVLPVKFVKSETRLRTNFLYVHMSPVPCLLSPPASELTRTKCLMINDELHRRRSWREEKTHTHARVRVGSGAATVLTSARLYRPPPIIHSPWCGHISQSPLQTLCCSV